MSLQKQIKGQEFGRFILFVTSLCIIAAKNHRKGIRSAISSPPSIEFGDLKDKASSELQQTGGDEECCAEERWKVFKLEDNFQSKSKRKAKKGQRITIYGQKFVTYETHGQKFCFPRKTLNRTAQENTIQKWYFKRTCSDQLQHFRFSQVAYRLLH